VVRHVVATAQLVTGDRTWTLAVLESAVPGLPAGWYGGADAEGGNLEERHRWASAAAAQSDSRGRSHHAEGPWGAFLAIEVQSDDTLRAILLAPWEGRRIPTSAEHSMLTLVGQHAAVALEHAVLYERLHEQTRQLDRLTGIQGDFLRSVTHDLQSPLTSIGGLAAELRESGRLTGAAREDLESIIHQAGRLRRMVAQLLTVTGLEAGAIVPRDEVFRLEPIVRRVWASLRSERPFSVKVSGPERLVTGDPDRVEQVVWALLDNAMKYSRDASPISVELRASTHQDGSIREELQIRDQGIGMDDETRLRAVERFYRSPTARTVAPDGSGIGLFTARGLVELMNGELEIESAVGAGTTMIVRLPAEPADASTEAEASGTNVRPPA
jgi:signal transduction histidine kinase